MVAGASVASPELALSGSPWANVPVTQKELASSAAPRTQIRTDDENLKMAPIPHSSK